MEPDLFFCSGTRERYKGGIFGITTTQREREPENLPTGFRKIAIRLALTAVFGGGFWDFGKRKERRGRGESSGEIDVRSVVRFFAGCRKEVFFLFLDVDGCSAAGGFASRLHGGVVRRKRNERSVDNFFLLLQRCGSGFPEGFGNLHDFFLCWSWSWSCCLGPKTAGKECMDAHAQPPRLQWWLMIPTLRWAFRTGDSGICVEPSGARSRRNCHNCTRHHHQHQQPTYLHVKVSLERK